MVNICPGAKVAIYFSSLPQLSTSILAGILSSRFPFIQQIDLFTNCAFINREKVKFLLHHNLFLD